MKGYLNEYALTAGLLLLCMSIAHAIYGEIVVFNDLRFMSFDRALFATIYLPWHQISLVLLLCSVGLVISSFKREYKPIQSFVLFVTLANLAIFLLTIVRSSGKALFFQAWPQIFLFIILVLLIVLGQRKKERQ